MTIYKKKYELLQEAVNSAGNEVTKEIAGQIELMQGEEKAQPTITKDEIMSVRDPKERIKLINENSKLFGGNQ